MTHPFLIDQTAYLPRVNDSTKHSSRASTSSSTSSVSSFVSSRPATPSSQIGRTSPPCEPHLQSNISTDYYYSNISARSSSLSLESTSQRDSTPTAIKSQDQSDKEKKRERRKGVIFGRGL